MNIEFVLLIIDYFRAIKRRDILSDWVLPLILSILYFILNRTNSQISSTINSLVDNSISLLGVLVGFSIAVITLLITASTANIDEIKKITACRISQYRTVSVFDVMIITYTYSVIMEVFLIIFNLFLSSFNFNNEIYTLKANLIASIDALLILHVLFVTIRNVTNFYFILIKK
ncbi:hypothetical protein [Pedobacter hartonius]|uniref:Uncharacterized protein n=1 Tax=Pedobacter hartonius TaxID=425514 RepID=A0A1H4DV66_9SPHI|nr:hypothetical protein [Pedobacter hartonius]SEA76673.1 hypothetical protein SAMN05443550_105121 [Pedobacter hartonius]